MGRGAYYVGEGELARTVKICHNLMLGIVAQAMAEITVLAEQSGVPRHAWLDFLNNSVMGSIFTRYKSPAYVNLDFAPTFTPVYLRKDLELGLTQARKVGTVMPLTAATRELVQGLIGRGHDKEDFATFLVQMAEMSGLKLAPENVKIDDGLKPARLMAPSRRPGGRYRISVARRGLRPAWRHRSRASTPMRRSCSWSATAPTSSSARSVFLSRLFDGGEARGDVPRRVRAQPPHRARPVSRRP